MPFLLSRNGINFLVSLGLELFLVLTSSTRWKRCCVCQRECSFCLQHWEHCTLESNYRSMKNPRFWERPPLLIARHCCPQSHREMPHGWAPQHPLGQQPWRVPSQQPCQTCRSASLRVSSSLWLPGDCRSEQKVHPNTLRPATAPRTTMNGYCWCKFWGSLYCNRNQNRRPDLY